MKSRYIANYDGIRVYVMAESQQEADDILKNHLDHIKQLKESKLKEE